MESKANIYRVLRQTYSFMTAAHAWACAQAEIDLVRRVQATGFEWQTDARYNEFATWEEAGFTLTARKELDELGWELVGRDFLGTFQELWAPHAIHHSDDPRILTWFVPAEPDYRHENYRRARSYGDDWHYVDVVVTASREGVVLGEARLCGIESDSDESHFTTVAFEQADEAIAFAHTALKNLCGCH